MRTTSIVPTLALVLGTALVPSSSGDLALPDNGSGFVFFGSVVAVETKEYEQRPGRLEPYARVTVTVDSLLYGADLGHRVYLFSPNTLHIANGELRVFSVMGSVWYKPGDIVFLVAQHFHGRDDVPSQANLKHMLVAKYVRFLDNPSLDPSQPIRKQVHCEVVPGATVLNWTPTSWTGYLDRSFTSDDRTVGELIHEIEELKSAITAKSKEKQ